MSREFKLKRKKGLILFYLIIITIFSFSNLFVQEMLASTDKSLELSVKSSAKKIKNDKNTGKKSTKKGSRKKKKKKKKTKYFSLNFKDVTITEFLNVMGQLIGKNIIIDDKIRGKITVVSAKKIPVSEAFEILKSILEVKGLAVVETKSLMKIIPVKDAIKKNVEIIIDGDKKKIQHDKEKTITFLLELQHSDAKEISSVLRSLKSKHTDIVVYSTLNTIIISGSTSELDGLIKIAKALDREVDEEKEDEIVKGNIHVVNLENADAEQLAGVLSRIPFSENAKISSARPYTSPKVNKSKKSKRVTRTQRVGSRQKSQSKLSIIANKETNSIIICAPPDEFKEIKRIIKKLDIVREQVLIEALIVEVTAESGWSYGFSWLTGHKTGSHMFGTSGVPGSMPSYSSSGLNGKELALPLSSGLQLGYLSDSSLLSFILFQASSSDKNFNILSTPQILTVDNNEAELNIGEEIPVPTNNRVSDSGVQHYTFDYKSVGVKLKITPHITSGDQITLDLYQEINSVLTQTTVLDSGAILPPKLGKRDISTKITVSDGRTIVVGGLIRNNKIVEEYKIPILGDIPLLGYLFRRKTVEYVKSNLLVFITPYVVTKKERLESITKQKRDEQRRLKMR